MSTLSAPTLQKLIFKVRTLLNSKDPNNSFWTDSELAEYLNDGLSIYFMEAVSANEGNFTTQVDLDIVANTALVALPTDCFKVKILYKKVTNGYVPLSYMNNLTSGYSTQGGTSSESFLPSYQFQGTNIQLSPIPNFNETGGLRMEYIQFPDQLVWSGDTLSTQMAPVFKQLLETYAVYKAKWRESLVNGGESYKPAEKHLSDIYNLYKQFIPKRSTGPTFIQPYNPETDAF